jgi:hypothetical protein
VAGCCESGNNIVFKRRIISGLVERLEAFQEFILFG